MDYECSFIASNGNVSSAAFHNLTSHCENDTTISQYLVFPATFFIQLIRFSLGVCVIVVLLAVYNFISVMNRHILNTAACSLYWVLMCFMIVFKSTVLMVFPILAWKINTTSSESQGHPVAGFNEAGFILQAVLQSAATLFLFLALDHEYRFRSPDYATVDTPTKHCIAMSCGLKLFCSWPRLVALVLTVLPLILLVAIEVVFHQSSDSMQPYLIWAYIATLPLTRLAGVVMGVALVARRRTGDKLKPSIPAKVYLIGGLLLSLMEDYPNFVTNCPEPTPYCYLDRLSIFNFFQSLGTISLLLFVFFVRSQYLRIEQESKLSLVWDLQKLLQVKGRRDIVRHYNT